jgi:tetratricopeptide (TPR) repeat protein
LIVLGIGGAAGAFLAFEPDRARELYDQYLGAAPVDAPRPPNPLRPSLDKWRSTISDVTGTPEEHLLAARTLHLGDSNESYSAANEALQRALLLDEDNTAVIGNWVENLMLWKLGAVPVDQIRLADEALKYAGALSPNEPAVFRGRAAIALARGDLNGCRSWAEKAIAADGSDVRARLLMASSYVEGNGQLAIQEAEQALRANPKLLRAERLLARAYADAGRYASAQRLIDKRIKDDSENAEVNILAGDVQRELGDLSAAEQRYRAATEDKGGSVRALLSLGDLLVEVGNHNEAMKFYRRVLSSKEVLPEHEAEANAGLARAELDRGRWKPAGKFAERAIEKDPRNAAALVALAEVELQSGSATTASSVAKQALDSQGGEPAALVIMGRAAIKQNQPDRALKHFEEAIHNEPRDPRLKSIMAAMYLHFGGSSQAFAVMRKVADMDPEQGVSRQRKRAIPLPVAAQTEAIDEFRKATTEARNRSVAYSSMAILYYHLHDTARAYEAIGNALESDDSNRAALLYQAQLSLERGQLDKAFQAAKLILDIDRASAMGHLMHARVLGKKGQVKEAEDEYDAAVRSEPGLMIAKVEMAGLSLKRGRKDEALQTLAEAYRLYPHMVATRRLLLEAGY